MKPSFALALAIALLLSLLAAGLVWAEEPAASPAGEAAPPGAARHPLATGLIALGAGLAVGLTALATALAQGRIGAAGAGTIAEKPETAGSVILLVAIPETMVILGFVIAIVIVFTL
jgi:V/A-type H+-transporting ATPase subunit K